MSGTYTPLQHPRHDRDVVEAGRADLDAERTEVALADDVVAHLAERVLGRHPRFALGHLDDARHLRHDRARPGCRRAAARRSWSPRGSPAGGPSSGRSCRRRGGSRPSSRPCPTPSAGPGRGAGRSRRRWRAGWRPDRPYSLAISAGITPMPRVRLWKISLPNSRSSISSQKFAQLLHHLAGLVDPALRQVVLEAADAVEVRVEAAAGRALDQVEHVLAVAEREEHRRDGTRSARRGRRGTARRWRCATARTGSCGSTGHAAAPRCPSASRRRG